MKITEMLVALCPLLLILLGYSFFSTNIEIYAFAQGTNVDEQPAFIKLVVLVNNTGGGTAQPSDFRVDVIPGNPSYFYGSENGTIVAVEKGNHSVLSASNTIQGVTYGTTFSGDCVPTTQDNAEVSINSGEKKTCTITKVYPNFP